MTNAYAAQIVISFTTALFLSGYAIQQRTVRHLRAAIKPDTSPHIFLPDRFRDDTTELADGTIVMLDDYGRPVRIKSGRISIGKAPESGGAGEWHDEHPEGGETVQVEIHETLPDIFDQQDHAQKVMAAEDSAAVEGSAETHELQVAEQSAPPPAPAEEHADAPAQPRPAPWEVRKEDLPKEQEPIENVEEGDQKPISRAERRRVIKEDIQKLSQGETPLYYQRRLW